MSPPLRRSIIAFIAMTLTFMAFVWPKSSLAAEIRLFTDDGKALTNYNNQIALLEETVKKNGSAIVQFSKNFRVQVFGIQSGNQNLILDIGNEKVLRIRKRAYKPFYFWKSFTDPTALVDSLQNYRMGHQSLMAYGIPVPQITNIPGHEKEFIVIEKIKIEVTYDEYMNPEFIKKADKKYLSIMNEAFLKFVEKTAPLRNIGDFGPRQLVYSSSRGWILLDFSNNHEIEGGTRGNVFEFDRYDTYTNADSATANSQREIISKPGLPVHIKEKALKVLNRARDTKESPSLCVKLFK